MNYYNNYSAYFGNIHIFTQNLQMLSIKLGNKLPHSSDNAGFRFVQKKFNQKLDIVEPTT